LLDDKQREQIGIRYKNAGQEEAIRLGYELATAKMREQRIQAWTAFCTRNPSGFLYCFRGGLRSHITQQWLQEQAGIQYPLVRGGYKAMRRFLMGELQQSVKQVPLICVSGLTGVGKTRVLQTLSHNMIDFEEIANHRGSAFGKDALDQQPSNIDWENRVSIEFLKHRERFPGQPVFVEDEGRRIGRVQMPDYLFTALQKAPRAILQLDIEQRIQLINEDYIQHNWPVYQHTYGDAAEEHFTRFLLDNLARIQKRLGRGSYHQVKQCFESGLRALYRNGQVDKEFYAGIRILLEKYYDPMYNYQNKSRLNHQSPILFEGSETEFLQWAEDYCAARAKTVQ